MYAGMGSANCVDELDTGLQADICRRVGINPRLMATPGLHHSAPPYSQSAVELCDYRAQDVLGHTRDSNRCGAGWSGRSRRRGPNHDL